MSRSIYRAWPKGVYVLAVLVLGACGGSGGTNGGTQADPAVTGTIARIEITPNTFLLQQPGATATLSARAFDANGNPVATAIAWSSNDTGAASVDANGTVMATGALGSAQIIAQAAGVTSAPALAVLAQPAAGAIIVSDVQVIDDPQAVDANAEYGLGWQYQVTLSGIAAPAVGAIIVGSGEQPVGGRVVSAVPDTSGNVVVTLEVIPLSQMFAALKIEQSISLKNAPYTVEDKIAARYDVARSADGRLTFMPRAGDAAVSSALLAAATPIGTSATEVFDCDSSFGPALTLTVPPVFALNSDVSVDFGYDSAVGGFQKFIVGGEVKAEFKIKPSIDATLAGEAKCNAQLVQLTVPMSGPLSLLFGAKVPLGVGFELKADFTLASLGFETSAMAKGETKLGVQCLPTCEMVTTLDGDTDGEQFKPDIPALDDPFGQFKLEAGIEGYGFANVKIGNPFLAALQFETFKSKFGLKQSLELESMAAQRENVNSASKFKLELTGKAGAGSAIQKLKNLLGIDFIELEHAFSVPLANSPSGSLTITPSEVKAGNASAVGELAKFTVTLDTSTYLGLDAVDGVEIKWFKNGTLEPGRPGCTSLPATSGQTVFTCQTDFLQEHLGEQTFYAFVKAKLFGVPLLVPLEVADNSAAKVKVTGGTGAVKLRYRQHRAVLMRDIQANSTYYQENQVRYTGAIDSLEAYNDSSDPAAHTVTEGNTGRADGALEQSVGFTADGNGNISGIAEAGSFQVQVELTAQASYPTDTVTGAGAQAEFDDTVNFIQFEVVGGPVNFTLTGSINVSSNNIPYPADGFVRLVPLDQLPLVSYDVCSGVPFYAPDLGMTVDPCAGVPATVSLAYSGMLMPGIYNLQVSMNGLVDLSSQDSGDQLRTSSGSYSAQMTFAPVE